MTPRRSLSALVVVVLAVVFAAPGAAFALAPQETPAPGEPRETTLDSGLRLLLLPRPGSGAVLTAVAVAAGSEDEPRARAGLSHFLEHLLFDGVDQLDERGVTEFFERRSAYINAFTREQTTVFFVLAPREEAAACAEMLAAMLTRSTIGAAAVEKERGVILEEQAKDAASPVTAREEALRTALWAGTPGEQPIGGAPDTVKTITRDDILAFWRAHYAAPGFRVLVAGDLSLDELNKIAAPFRNLPRPKGFTAPARQASLDWPGWGTWRAAAGGAPDEPTLELVIAPPRGSAIDGVALDVLARWLGDDQGPLARALVPDLARSVSVNRSPRQPDDVLAIRVEAKPGRAAAEVLSALLSAIEQAGQGGGPDDAAVARLARAESIERAITGQRLHYVAALFGEAFATTRGSLRDAVDPPAPPGPIVQGLARSFLTGARARSRGAWSGDGGPATAAPLPEPIVVTPAAQAAGMTAGPGGSRVVTLANGLVVAVLEELGSPVFGISVLVADRSLREPADEPGISDLAHRLLGAGAGMSPGDSFSRRLQRAGIEVKSADDPMIPYDDDDNAPEYSYLRLEGPSSSLFDGVELLAEMLRETRWDAASFDRALALHKQERQAQSQGAAAASLALRARLYGPSHPLARPVAGRVDDPLPTSDQVHAFFGPGWPAGYFAPERMIVSICGAAGAEDIVDAVKDVLGDGPAKAPQRGPLPPAAQPPAMPGEAAAPMPAAPTASPGGAATKPGSPSMPDAAPAKSQTTAESASPTKPGSPPASAKPAFMPGMPPTSQPAKPGGMHTMPEATAKSPGAPTMPPTGATKPGGMPPMGMGGAAAQVNLVWGALTRPEAKDRAALLMAVNALSDRMVAVIREKEGLAYRLGAGVRAMPDGQWLISASVGTRPDNREKVQKLFADIAAKLGAEDLAPSDLERLAARVREREMLARLSAGARAARVARQLFESDGAPLLVGFEAQKNATPAEVRAAAAAYLDPARLVFVEAR